MKSIKLELRTESWENIFYVIRKDPPAEPKGNFWAAIQYLETQLETCIKQEKNDYGDCVPEEQLDLDFNQEGKNDSKKD